MQTCHHQSRVALIKIIQMICGNLKLTQIFLFLNICLSTFMAKTLRECGVCASDGGQARHRENQIFIKYWMSCLLPFIFYRLFILSICLVMCMLMLRGKVCRSDGGADWLWTAPMIYHCPCPPQSTMHVGFLKMISQGQQHHHNFHFSFFLRSKSRSWPGLHPWGYFQIRAVFPAARETNFFNTLTRWSHPFQHQYICLSNNS